MNNAGDEIYIATVILYLPAYATKLAPPAPPDPA
jgi:hypothetical protein